MVGQSCNVEPQAPRFKEAAIKAIIITAALLMTACGNSTADTHKHNDCDQVRIGAKVAMAASLDDAPIETMERAFRAEGWPIALLRETYSMEGDGRPHEVQVNEFGSKAFRECRARNE